MPSQLKKLLLYTVLVSGGVVFLVAIFLFGLVLSLIGAISKVENPELTGLV